MAKPVGEIIANCPKCNKPIGDKNPYAWCVDCGEPFTPEIKAKIPLLFEREQGKERREREPQASGTVRDEQLKQPVSKNPVMNRYLDLYRIARVLVTIGDTVKVIGIIIGAGIFFLSLLAGGAAGNASVIGALGFAGAIYGAIVGGFIALFGVIIAAQGQMLLAQADSAVHTSPFMNNDEKARVMSI